MIIHPPSPRPGRWDEVGETQPAEPQEELRIVGVNGHFAGRRFALTGTLRLGRLPDQNDLVFPADTTGVSGVHCVVRLTSGGATLTDLAPPSAPSSTDRTRSRRSSPPR